MTPPMTYDFATEFAGFLCAIHDSFLDAPRAMPDTWENKNKAPVQQFLFDQLLQVIPDDGPILEFGVFKGITLNMIARACPTHQIFGFDSFKGLPPDGRKDWRMKFKQDALPEVPDHVQLIEGYFENTLPVFSQNLIETPALVHVDCDLYSSTETILTNLAPQAGQIILFDELINYARFAMNEVLALYLYLKRTNLDFEWVCPIGNAFDYRGTDGVMLKGGMAGHRAAGYFQNQAVRLTKTRQHFNTSASDALIENIHAQLNAHYG